MGGKRSGGKPPGSKIQKRRPPLTSEERLYSLATVVGRACDRWLIARGLPVKNSPWTKSQKPKVDYLAED
jgi:hypothetical protein